MAIITSQTISQYYEKYAEEEITFTKDVINTTGLQTKEILLKCGGEQWHCILYSSSMHSAKIVVNLESDHFEKLRQVNNSVSLRFVFNTGGKSPSISFFVSAKVTGYSQYNKEKSDLSFVSLSYTQRPADDLIAIIGKIVEVNSFESKRSDVRISASPETMRKLGLNPSGVKVFIQNIPRSCILRDISFSGAKVIIQGVGKLLVGKDAILRINLEEINKSVILKGSIIHYEGVADRKDITAIGIRFEPNALPMEFKFKLSEYLRTAAGRKLT